MPRFVVDARPSFLAQGRQQIVVKVEKLLASVDRSAELEVIRYAA
jgi:hypothetical protein